MLEALVVVDARLVVELVTACECEADDDVDDVSGAAVVVVTGATDTVDVVAGMLTVRVPAPVWG